MCTVHNCFDLYNQWIRKVDFQEEFCSSSDNYCSVRTHRTLIHSLYAKIINALCEAGDFSYGDRGSMKGGWNALVAVWNKLVK